MSANIFLIADTKEELIESINKVNAAYKVFDKDGNDMLLKPFDTKIISD